MAALDAEKAARLADLEAHRLKGDLEAAAEAVQAIADNDVARQNLTALCNQYVTSQNPPQPPELTQEERNAKPWTKMDYGDVWEMAKSKFGPPDEKMFRAGIAETQRRRLRGE